MKGITENKTVVEKICCGFTACLFSLMTLNSAQAAPIEIADIPLFLGGSVAPNIMFVIDDSGSMQFEIMPESIMDGATNYLFPPVSNMYGDGIYSTYIHTFQEDNGFNYRFRSSSNNSLFYDPSKTYEPWYKADGTQWPDADPEAAFYFPGREDSGSLNLTSSHEHSRWVIYFPGDEDNGAGYYFDNNERTYWPITFHIKLEETGSNTDSDNFKTVQIKGGEAYITNSNGDGETSEVTSLQYDDGTTRSIEEEKQNFANWFSYYRSRTLAARSGIGRAFSRQPEGLRIGYGSLNKSSSDVDGVNTSVISEGVRLFTGSDRENFFERLYTDDVPNEGTPLRKALDRAGKYYKRTDNAGPWGAEPGTDNNATHLECRQSFTILMTDGYYSGNDADVGNVDGSNGPQIGDYQYTPVEPFKDGRSETLADVAMEYWINDLRPDLINDVPTNSPIDPAFWQHMVTFGIGLGVEGEISSTDAFDAILTNDSIDWPSTDSNSGKVDDLLHAAVNGRGGFFSAANPDKFAKELGLILDGLVALTSASSTSAAASSAVLRQDSLSFSAGFRSDGWSGALQAAQILDGGARGGLVWDAEFELEDKGASGRDLFTFASGSGVELGDIANLSAAQQEALDRALDGSDDGLGQARINWLRGDLSANSDFRSRQATVRQTDVQRVRLLGDIIGSNPQFAGKANLGYRRLPGDQGDEYAVYRSGTAYQSRPDVIYVGANDGYLHGFDALTGEELFGYMPGELLQAEPGKSFAPVNRLMDPEYSHRYYVDGTPTISDAYINNQWRSILVGTMGAGGRTVFALDVSDPENFSASDVLWEFTHPDLGYGAESPQIVRLPGQTARWAAVFGNGYNSDSNESGLFVVNLANGSLIDDTVLMTGAGDDNTPNGMAPPVIRVNATTGVAETAYAGDLLGNLWRFNLATGSETKLFTATDPGGTTQPITAAPSVALNPDSGSQGGVVVTFGTGSYFRAVDSGNNQIQSLYGIFDSDSNGGIDRGNLLEQDITEQATAQYGEDMAEIRVLSQNSRADGEKGWVIDLDTSTGERIVSQSSYPSGFPIKRVRFSTLIPDNNDCGIGRTGYLMDVNLATGGRTVEHVFDLDRDGTYDSGDAAQGGNVSNSASGNVVNGIKGVVRGEALSVVLDNTTDLFVESKIEEILEPPVPPCTPGTDCEEDEDENEDENDDDEPPADGDECTGPLCGQAPGYNFGRQNWEELR